MFLLDLIFPKKCVVCKTFGDYLCPNCFSNVSYDTHIICLICGKLSVDGMTHPRCRSRYAIDGAFCGVLYNYTAKKLVYVFKYQPYLFDIKTLLVDLCYESLIQNELFMQTVHKRCVCIPVPLSQSKLKKRGYNQAFLLARGLSQKFSLPLIDCLQRIKETTPQFGLHRHERKINVKDAFAIKKGSEQLKNYTAFLIDDVLTTGATLAEAARVLKRNGFQKVYGVTFARDE